MIGRRLYEGDDLDGVSPGDYWLGIDRNPGFRPDNWMAAVPVPMADGDLPHLANLGRHDVTVHDDGTITVSPSILLTCPDGSECYHGFLERGVWRSC